MASNKTSSDIIGRVEYVRTYLGLNKSRFSAEIGMKPQTYNNFIGAQASKPSVDLIMGIVNRFGINPEWLLNGQSEMFKEGAAKEPHTKGQWDAAVADRTLGGHGVLSVVNGKMQGLEEKISSLEQKLQHLNPAFAPTLVALQDALSQLNGTDAAQALRDVEALVEKIKKPRK